MKRQLVCLTVFLLILATSCDLALADVGQCTVLFRYMPSTHKSHLNTKQQDEIGERLMKAHMNSGRSDRHAVFVCYLTSDDTDVIYRITEPKDKIGTVSEIYNIAARDFTAMRQAIAVVEQEFKGGPPLPRVRKTTPEKTPPKK